MDIQTLIPTTTNHVYAIQTFSFIGADRASIIRDGPKMKWLPHSMYYTLHIYVSVKMHMPL